NRNLAELIARGAVQMHVSCGAEGVRGDRAEIAIFGTEFVRQLAVRPSLVAHMRLLGGMRPRPRITAIAADHRIGEASPDPQGGERHRENLARATIVERGRKARVDAESFADELGMAVGLVGAPAD